MFFYTNDENAEAVERKNAYQKEAQKIWGFLTDGDILKVKNATQLASIVRARTGVSDLKAMTNVQNWMQGKQF